MEGLEARLRIETPAGHPCQSGLYIFTFLQQYNLVVISLAQTHKNSKYFDSDHLIHSTSKCASTPPSQFSSLSSSPSSLPPPMQPPSTSSTNAPTPSGQPPPPAADGDLTPASPGQSPSTPAPPMLASGAEPHAPSTPMGVANAKLVTAMASLNARATVLPQIPSLNSL